MCYQNWEVWIYTELWRLCWTLPQNYYRVWKRLMQISMQFHMKSLDFEYHVAKWLKYDRSVYNSSHPSLGSLWMVWCIELTSSGHIWSFPTCLKMVIFTQNHHFQAYRKWPNTTTITKFNASNHLGGPQGWLRWVINRSVIFKPFCDMIFKI